MTSLDIADVRALIADDLTAVDRLIEDELHSNVALVDQLGAYIIGSGGKRLRPLILLLSARASAYQGHAHVVLAAIVEIIHTATLLHDDVVDDSALRRGRETANAVWGNEASVLVGDFLYSRSFQMMVRLRNLRVMDILADTTNTIAEGEVMQLLNCHDPDTTEQRYMEVIRSKTAKLFEAAAQIGSVIADGPPEAEAGLAAYGNHVGAAFQLVDDVLDYSADDGELGKNIGDDLAEGKPTMPLIYAMRGGSPEEVQAIREAIRHGGRGDIAVVSRAIESTGAIAYTARLAREEADRAIDAIAVLPESNYKDALIGLAGFSVNRSY